MADLQMNIYNSSPIWAQNILTTFQGHKLKKVRFGNEYFNYLSELRKRDYSDYSKMKLLQDYHVNEIVRHANEYSGFYKEFYKDIDMSSIKTVKDLVKLPILEKELARNNLGDIYTIPFEKGIKTNTSGTTGTTMIVLYTVKDMQRRMAYLDFFKEKHGFIHMKMKRASFNASKIVPSRQKKPVFWRDNLAIKQRIYSGFYCQGGNIKYYIENLNRYKPDSLDGYPSSLYQLARYVINNNIKLDFKPIAIFPTAETLLPHYKSSIEKAFNCPVLDQYASTEGAPFITSCKHGNLHYCMDTGVIEIDNNGDMLVTCFETHGTPLIRYRIGDRITFANPEKTCPCDSSMPIVEKIDGRGHDYLISKTKGKFPALYMSLVSEEFQSSIKAMQFIQDNIDEIKVLLEVDGNYNETMNKIIIDKLHYSLGDDMAINILVVDKIPKEESGKFRLIKNNLIGSEKNNGTN